ncbi:BAG family molecular chaperone regulator 6 [Malania oleifera]|uniref:BAG family molecular chaperone regulator 6 n=1 Tax=Malania oleifera TaxID=397392 RepID=UPI0025ADF7E0|nr:BAG family molecular chaperone regulator 6 [Malania oleifera]
MLPAYRCMESHPHEGNRNGTPFFQHYHPSFEAIPSYMKVEPGKNPLPYESWPYTGNYGYTLPCHACCNHNYFPSYYSFRRPYHHNLPDSPSSCIGGYPAFPGYYPVYYVPPHYSVEQPRYVSEKNVPKTYYCCGCTSHVYNLKEGKSLKIEEQEPDLQKMGSASLVPTELKNSPYQIVWMPPGFARNNENQMPLESKVKDEGRTLCDAKPPERGAQEPVYGWFPLDLNRLGSLKHRGGGGGGDKLTQNHQDGQVNNPFPYPIIWMPSSHKSEETERKESGETNNAPKSVEEQPSNFKIISVKVPDSENGMTKPDMDGENSGGVKVKDKIFNLKDAPVKQMEQPKDKDPDGNSGQPREIPVKPIKSNGEKEPHENGAKRHSSPPKISKLPPVCLRVDPLPRKKNGNGSSRSPSPPGNREKLGEVFTETSKLPNLSGLEEKVMKDLQVQHSAIDESKMKPSKNGGTVIDVMVGKADQTHESSNEALQNGSQGQVPANLSINSHVDGGTCIVESQIEAAPVESIKVEKSVNNAESGDYNCNIENDGAREMQQQKFEEDNKISKQSLTTIAAAVIIQSAFRGFKVRKWEPLKKLKQIAEVCDQLAEIRSRVQALEYSNLGTDNKERAVIGETIMSLLLKLDTIQGLHLAIREIRKSAARELTSLQEKLDSLVIESTEEFAEKISAVDNICGCACEGVRSHEGQIKQLEEGEHTCSESNCGKNSSHAADDDCCRGKETLGATSVNNVDRKVKSSETDGIEPKLAGLEPFVKAEGKEAPGKLDAGHAVMTEVQKGDSDLEHSVELRSGVGKRINSKMELHENEQMEASTDLQEKELLLAVADNSTPADKALEVNQQVEDEEPLLPESAKHEPVEARETQVQHNGDAVSNEAADVMLQGKEGSLMSQLDQQLLGSRKGGAVMAELESVGVRLGKSDEILGNKGPEELLEQSQTEEVRHVNGIAEVSQPEESQALFPSPDGENHDNELRHVNGIAEVSQQEESQGLLPLPDRENHDNELIAEASYPEESQALLPMPDRENHNDEPTEEQKSDGLEYDLSSASASRGIASEEKAMWAENSKEGGPNDPTNGVEEDKEGQEKTSTVYTPYLEPADIFFASKETEGLVEETKRDAENQPVATGEDDDEQLEGEMETLELQPGVGKDEMVVQPMLKNTEDDDTNHLAPTGEEEEELDGPKVESQELASMTENAKMHVRLNESEAKVLTRTHSGAQLPEEKRELFPVLHTSKQIPLEEHDLGKGSSHMLLEENKKLREMMEKLMEEGKEQLTVISRLTGRVKDLERKLGRKNRLRTRPFRASASEASACSCARALKK